MKNDLRSKVIKLRKSGLSYSQIKRRVDISKSTLSVWLRDMPLSPERIKKLRDLNPIRIERCRNTKLKRREEKLDLIYKKVSAQIDILNNRELYLAGLFLYWGEGTKSSRDIVAFTNSDPLMMKFYMSWLKLLKIPNEKIRVKLHLYSDMNIKKSTKYWMKTLNLSKNNFRKPYIKDSKSSSITYKNSYGHGTCSVIFGSSLIHNEIMMSIKYLKYIVSEGKLG